MNQQKIQHLQEPAEEVLLATNRSLRNEIVALLLDIAELREINERPSASRPIRMSCQQNGPSVALRRVHR